jgi:hypothetical protein
MAAGVLIEACAILQEYVQEVFGGNQLLEEKADGLLDRERFPPFGRENDPIFGLDSVDPLLHFLFVSSTYFEAKGRSGTDP